MASSCFDNWPTSSPPPSTTGARDAANRSLPARRHRADPRLPGDRRLPAQVVPPDARRSPGGVAIAAGDAVDDSNLTAALLDAGAIHPIRTTPRHTIDDVTVVVPTLGVAEHAPTGAIVVDDGSWPPVPDARLRLATNQGPAAARNAGLDWSRRRSSHSSTATSSSATAGSRRCWPTSPTNESHWLLRGSSPIATTRRSATTSTSTTRSTSGPTRHGFGSGTRVSYVPAAAIVCRTDAIRAIGGFDPSLRFGEDVDLVWRLAEAGWVCRYEPATVVHHARRPDLASWVRQRIEYGSSAAALSKRHPGALAPLRMSGWSVAAWALGAIGRPVSGALVGAGSAIALTRKLPEIPAPAALRLAGLGNLRAGDQIGAAVRRVWWPLLAVAAWRSKSARRVFIAAAIGARHPLRLADDVAYSVGVWSGMTVERTVGPLVPEISSWPGRSASRGPQPLADVVAVVALPHEAIGDTAETHGEHRFEARRNHEHGDQPQAEHGRTDRPQPTPPTAERQPDPLGEPLRWPGHEAVLDPEPGRDDPGGELAERTERRSRSAPGRRNRRPTAPAANPAGTPGSRPPGRRHRRRRPEPTSR